MFAPPVARALARRADSAPLRSLGQLVRETYGADALIPSLESLYTSAYAYLWSAYRAEYCYKNAIARHILLGRHSLRTTTMLTEFRVGTSKADVVLINGTTTVYEIKTALDSLDRLPGQLTDYCRVFDYVNVVTHADAIDRLAAVLPPNVGLLELTSSGRFRTHRAADSNLTRLQPGWMLDALRRDEYVPIIADVFGRAPALPNTHMYDACRDLFEQLAPARAHAAFADALRRRARTSGVEEIIRDVVPALSALCLSAGFDLADASAFREALRQPLSTIIE
ncbi:MAG: sce7726 family protein [Gemmatimonadaceae bacterium]|nr:sce7726 family protein [Gemmatimonadaceae bacterium]